MHVWTHSNNLSNYHTWVISLPLVRYKTTRSSQYKTNYATSLFCSLGISVQLLILFNCATSDSLVKQSVSSSIFTFVTLALAATSSKGLAWSDVHWCSVDALSAALWCSLGCNSVAPEAPYAHVTELADALELWQ